MTKSELVPYLPSFPISPKEEELNVNNVSIEVNNMMANFEVPIHVNLRNFALSCGNVLYEKNKSVGSVIQVVLIGHIFSVKLLVFINEHGFRNSASIKENQIAA